MRSRAEAGFTLLELVVAASILALIAVFSWRGLDALIREREAIAASQATIDALQRAFARVERDALSSRDAELEDGGALRLVSADDGGVEYRLADGALTRRPIGGDAGPAVPVLDGLAGLKLEVWAANPRGGAWVRAKGAATLPVAPTRPDPPPASGTTLPQATPPGTTVAPASPTPLASIAPATAAATGIRLSLQRADGASLVRTFLVGGG